MSYTVFNQRFGIEIETAGCKRDKIAQAIKSVVNGTVSQDPSGAYSATLVTQPDGRQWRVQNDRSIMVMRGTQGSEIVSPILTYEDLPILQLIIRAVKLAGCIPHRSCSVHIHVDAAPHTATSLANLAKMVYRNEDMLYQAIGTSEDRRNRWTKPLEQEFIDRLVKHRPDDMNQLNRAWYGRQNNSPEHYDSSRYHGLNFNNLWRTIQTIEFRYFNASLNTQKITSWIQLVLAMSAKALCLKQTTHNKIKTDNPKFNFRVFMVAGLGMKGSEFKVARTILLEKLPGNGTWRYGKPEKKLEVASVQ
ncbi:MAG: amidoligase family protein [bacterium]|nr:amidoligase family protein [bacterium]